jgi:hypothetical protein
MIEDVLSIVPGTSTELSVSVKLHNQQEFTDCYDQWLPVEGDDRERPVTEVVTYSSEESVVDASPFIHMIHNLPDKCQELLILNSACLLAKTLLTTDSCHPDPFVTLASVCRQFHCILTTQKWFARAFQQFLTVVCRPYRLNPPQLKKFDGQDCAVHGLTTLHNELFVVYLESHIVHVYCIQPPYTRLPDIPVTGLEDPQGIAACSISSSCSCLYVLDWRFENSSHCVWEVTDGKADKWLDDVGSIWSLSVTPEGHIVMLIRIPDLPRKVDIYDTNKVKLSSLQLPPDIDEPHHVIQTVDKSFIVCIGDESTGLNRVCEVNSKGEIGKSCGKSRGSGQLNKPMHIAQDREERVFIADCDNDRVLLWDKRLNILHVLLTWSSGKHPRRLFFDRQTTQLIVGLESGEVEIFSLL